MREKMVMVVRSIVKGAVMLMAVMMVMLTVM